MESKDRGLKHRKPFSTNISIDNAEKLDRLHKITEVPKSKLTDQALELLFQKYKDKLGD